MKYFLVVLVGFVFTGCLVTKTPVSEYMIDANMVNKNIILNGCCTKSIKVAKSFSSLKLQTLNMNYTQGNNKLFSYSQSVWAESPNNAITLEILKLLRDKKLFKTVQTSKSRAKSDLILETNIEKFIQYFDDKLESSYVEVSITFTIIDAKTNKVVSSRNFQAKELSSSLDAMGGVKALNLALSKVLSKSMYLFEEVCK